ncbi:MAG: endonuclease III [Caldiserica bacterium]|nr:endonuclease III [Caldisericota bacterium]
MWNDKKAVKILETLAGYTASWNKPYVERVGERRDPFQLLIACILSLRTKDEVTAKAARRLFSEASTPETLLTLNEEKISQLIYPVGFYRKKARTIRDISRILVEKHNSRVPDNWEELLSFPGVGRKTAALVLSQGYGKPAICVDTHVHRISNRWGLVKTATPQETEQALMQIVPVDYWQKINPLLVIFGQAICKPISPLCSKCPLRKECQKAGVKIHR